VRRANALIWSRVPAAPRTVDPADSANPPAPLGSRLPQEQDAANDGGTEDDEDKEDSIVTMAEV
jgi:hypothetical protein